MLNYAWSAVQNEFRHYDFVFTSPYSHLVYLCKSSSILCFIKSRTSFRQTRSETKVTPITTGKLIIRWNRSLFILISLDGTYP